MERPSQERIMLFRRGFRDGAGTLAYRHKDEPDYMHGYALGIEALGHAVGVFCKEIGYDPTWDILRGVDGSIRQDRNGDTDAGKEGNG